VEILEQHHRRATLRKRRDKVPRPIKECRTGRNRIRGVRTTEGLGRGREIVVRLIAAKRLRPRTVRWSFGQIVTTTPEDERTLLRSFLAQRPGERRLAHSRLAAYEHQAAAPVECGAKMVAQPAQLALAAD